MHIVCFKCVEHLAIIRQRRATACIGDFCTYALVQRVVQMRTMARVGARS